MLGGSCSPCCGCTQARAFQTYQLILQSSVSVALQTDVNYGQSYTTGFDGLISNSPSVTNLPDYNLTQYKQGTRYGTYALSRESYATESTASGESIYVVSFEYLKAHLFINVVFVVVTEAEKEATYRDWPALQWPGTGCPVFCSARMFSYVGSATAPASVYSQGGVINKQTERIGLPNSFTQSPFYLTSRVPHYLLGAYSIDFGSHVNEISLTGPASHALNAIAFWINGDLPENEYDARASSLNIYSDALVLCPPPNTFQWLRQQGGTEANRVNPYLSAWSPSSVVIETPPATASYARTAFVPVSGGYSQFGQVIGEPRYNMTPPTGDPSVVGAWTGSRLIATAGYDELLATTQNTATTTAQISVTYA